jgi:diacylglycerol kinase
METTTQPGPIRIGGPDLHPEPPRRPRRRWADKFAEAFRGIRVGLQGQSSFFVHLFFAVLAMATALVLDCTAVEWCLIVGCIGFVFVTELLNTSLEILFRGLAPEARDRVYPCLDVAAGAVLVASLTAVVVGGIVFGRRLLMFLNVEA